MARLQAEYTRMRVEIAEARAELAAQAAEPLFTEEEKKQLQEVAESGRMGARMAEFANEVEQGDADWESFIRGRDGREGLLHGFLERAEEEFGDEVEQALVESEPPPDIDDPRPPDWPARRRGPGRT